jgi:hypothetical protein
VQHDDAVYVLDGREAVGDDYACAAPHQLELASLALIGTQTVVNTEEGITRPHRSIHDRLAEVPSPEVYSCE